MHFEEFSSSGNRGVVENIDHQVEKPLAMMDEMPQKNPSTRIPLTGVEQKSPQCQKTYRCNNQ
jgi:hypothetical protein